MRLSVAAAVAAFAFVGPPPARGAPLIEAPSSPPPIDPPVIVHAPAYQIQLIAVRFTYFDQDGLGYQSAAGPVSGPGSERTTVAQPAGEVVATIGDRLTQRLVTSVDVVTAASPNHKLYGLPVGTPVDVISSPSRINEAEQIDSDTTYAWSRTINVGVHADYHLEEPLESWGLGMFATRAFADDNTVLSASLFQIVDWFDDFHLDGKRYGRDVRTTTNINLGVTQLLTPTTIVLAGYGFTTQGGTLTNTWNSVPLSDETRGAEIVPRRRNRHAFSGRLVEWLPWQGALRLGYRFYADSWGSVAHTVDANVSQRVGQLTLDLGGRYHRQSAVEFFGTVFDPIGTGFRTADSDLEAFTALAISAGARWDQPIGHRGRQIYFALSCERYVRSNDLHVDFVSVAVGLQR